MAHAAHLGAGCELRREQRDAGGLVGEDVVDLLAVADLVGDPLVERERAPVALHREGGAFDLLADNFIRARRPNVAGVIAAAPPAADDQARYRRRRFLPWNVADDEGKLVLIAPGGDLVFDEEDGDALDVALSGKPFQLAELKCADPPAMLRRLWTGGLIERLTA